MTDQTTEQASSGDISPDQDQVSAQEPVDPADTEDGFDEDTVESRRSVWKPALIAAAVALCLALVAVFFAMDRGDGTPGDGSPEAGFARDMAIHHEQAVELAFIVRDRTDNKEVQLLAYDIINTQANQRGIMLGWLDVWGLTPTSSAKPMSWMGMDDYRAHDGSLMPGMATNTEMNRLRNAKGRAAEVLFLKEMIAHHKGGIEMAQGAVDLSDNGQVDRMAQGIIAGQKSEITMMNEMLKDRGAAPVS